MSQQPKRAPQSTGLPSTLILHEGKGFELCVLDDLISIEAIKGEWEQLEAKSNEPYGYFQSSDWCLKWALQYADPKTSDDCPTLQVYTLSGENGICMILPMMAIRSRTTVQLLVPLSEPTCQYSGVLYDHENFDELLGQKVIQEIIASTWCDALAFGYFPVSSMLAKMLGEDGFEESVEHASSILDLSEIRDWDSYHTSLPRSQRKERNRRRNKLTNYGKLSYEVHSSKNAAFKQRVAICLEMKNKWLESTGRNSSVLSDERAAIFMGMLGGQEYEKRGRGVFVHALCMNGEPIAVELGMLYANDYYSFLGAYDVDWHNYSPGKVQIEFAQKWAKDRNVRYFDFLNDPSGYKSYWTNKTEPLACRYIPISTIGYVYCRFWKAAIRPKIKSIYHNADSKNRAYFQKLLSVVPTKSKSE